MVDYRIPFNRPSMLGNEQAYMLEALANGHISGDGAFTRRCTALLEQVLGVKKALLTTSCTHALEMAAHLLNIKPCDEVIVPSFTFVSTVNAFVLRGARPVFIDIRADTLNMDEARLERVITPRTKAIVVVHYAGVACEMDRIISIAQRYGITVVEDNAHGLFGKYNGHYLGTLGAVATLSFHETKNFTCGEGGAILINDSQYIDRAEIIREKGTNRNRFFRGEVDKYTWVDIGSSYLPSDILAGFLLGQLEARNHVQARRKQIWEYYNSNLQAWAEANSVKVPMVPAHCEQPYHLFYICMPSFQERQRLIAHMRTRGILSVFHYVPLHLSEMGATFGYKKGDCPISEDISDRLVRLPLFTSLSADDQESVIESILSYTP